MTPATGKLQPYLVEYVKHGAYIVSMDTLGGSRAAHALPAIANPFHRNALAAITMCRKLKFPGMDSDGSLTRSWTSAPGELYLYRVVRLG